MTGSASTHLNEQVAERGVPHRHSGGLTNGWCDQRQTAKTEEEFSLKKNTRVVSFSFHRGMSVILGPWQITFSSQGFPNQVVVLRVIVPQRSLRIDQSVVSVIELRFSVSVPVRGGPADRSDAVILGVSEPPLHWHALSFGEPPRPDTHTHAHTHYNIKDLSSSQDLLFISVSV